MEDVQIILSGLWTALMLTYLWGAVLTLIAIIVIVIVYRKRIESKSKKKC